MKSIATYRRISKEETARKTDAYIHQGWLLDRKVADFPERQRISFEDMQSGRKDDRPDFLRLVAAIESDLIDVLIVTRIDRIGRDVESNARLQKQLQRKNVLVFEILLGRFLDWQNPNDWSYFVQAGLDGEKESRMLSTRVRQTFEFLKSQGKVGGGTVGFPCRRSKDGFVEPDPEQWEIGVSCILIVLEEGGATMKALARIRALGLNRTRVWLSTWIRSPLLRGYFVGSSGGTHISLFSDPRLNGAERQLDRIIADSTRIKGANRSRPVYPLSGLIYCARCGSHCHIKTISNSKYPNKKYTYVMCGQRANKGLGCGGEYGNTQGHRKSINAVYDEIETEVILALSAKATELINIEIRQVDTNTPENPAISKLKIEIDRLKSFDDIDLLGAIAKKTEHLNNLLLANPIENYSLAKRDDFIKAFACGEVLAFASDVEKRSLYRDWIQQIKVDKQQVTVVLAI